MAYENLLVATRGGVAFVTIAREAKRNALDARTVEELGAQEGETALFGDLVASADVKEGTRAFLEKRAPRFEGR